MRPSHHDPAHRPRRRRLAATAITAFLGVATALVAATLPTAASAAGSLTATFTSTGNWGSGHEVAVRVTNGSSAPVSSWTLEFDLPAGVAITSSWDADVTRSGNHYRATSKSWAGALAPGATQQWGYVASGPFGAPSGCTVNGGSCSGGPGPSPTPTTPTPTPTTPTPTPTTPTPTPTTPGPSGQKVVGYFAEWGVYGRGYHVKNIETSGSADKLTHILYAFGNTTNGRCSIGDSYADYEKAYTAAESVDGVADTWDQPLRGSFNQLRKLKAMHPDLKVIWSFGGWTWSGGFTQAAQNPQAFAESCYNLVEDPRWADVFDGIDVDWEYPNACGLTCDTSGPKAFDDVVTALRNKFGSKALVTAAITADGSNGGKIDATDYATAAQKLDWIMPMTYDYFGAFNPQGPTAPHSPLTSYSGIPQAGFNSADAVAKLKAKGVPSNKILLGIGFYGRGWNGVTQTAPGGTATGPAPGTYEQGIEDYKVLKNRCPATGTVGGTAYAKCGTEWWSYDTPSTINGKMTWAKNQGLGGAFFWELSGDTSNGELITAISNGLR
ncbi:glycosyl hydrolase family 18 protein [Cellulomonas fimi]|uniref:chitinase n=1 Tax=Cellulomonas fimi (strain ATCC 484 / DSM 20113 / JCM 1341 / CCUG 24087 / LMG 16345 / NBRC 15513 / NCIMB 8980 / NCTC 7547 / NRS-133) TaxID=590998 RepID=F4GZV9_CELFA|nr:glycosyl hydrolase family 18 protein [Cellulomonas fimi]AEE47275.1 glycoside hydrolase family 18 [Cellulomonas fimi ATCC 484]NNH06989.1 chitinase [Cellulomonas fimi]VEH35783.1 Chitinase 63 precursor [Cellulomonas fimi]